MIHTVLIVNSKLPSAEKFERWVFDEVLPTIRKHGSYTVPVMSSTDLLELQVRALREIEDRQAKQEQALDDTNKRCRMAQEGVSKSKREKTNKLDVIADDKKLIEIYTAIVK